MAYTVYLLKSKKAKKSYVGFTQNLEKRLKEHNSGNNHYTSKFPSWEVIYTEKYERMEEAIEREQFFKTTRGRRALKRIFDRLNLN